MTTPHQRQTFITPKNILVLGAGSFGTACAAMFARGNNLNRVVIYDYKQPRVDSINHEHRNPDYLSDFTLPLNITSTTSPEEAFLDDVDFIFHAIPVQVSMEYLENIKPYVDKIIAAKQESYQARINTLVSPLTEKPITQENPHGKEEKSPQRPELSPPQLLTPSVSVSCTKITIAGMEFNIPNHPNLGRDSANNYGITDKLDLQFIKPLVVISMSKGIHQTKLKCMHEIIDEIFGFHRLHVQTPMVKPKNVIRWDKKHNSSNSSIISSKSGFTNKTKNEKIGPIGSEQHHTDNKDDDHDSNSHISYLDILTDASNNVDPSISLFSPLLPEQQHHQDVNSLLSPLPNSLPPTIHTTDPYKDSNSNTALITPSFIHTCYLSGPSFAKEIISHEPTGFTIACTDLTVATLVGEVLSQDFTTMCSTTTDIWGVEVAGALKNVYAIGAGLIDKFQYNTRALFITRSCNEMKRIGMLLYKDKVDRATFSTLAGIGDLLLTCLGPSRNRRVGIALADGQRLADIKSQSDELAEGVPTTAAIYSLLSEKNLIKFCPILLCVYRVLYEDMPVKEAMVYLLSLPVVEEQL